MPVSLRFSIDIYFCYHWDISKKHSQYTLYFWPCPCKYGALFPFSCRDELRKHLLCTPQVGSILFYFTRLTRYRNFGIGLLMCLVKVYLMIIGTMVKWLDEKVSCLMERLICLVKHGSDRFVSNKVRFEFSRRIIKDLPSGN